MRFAIYFTPPEGDALAASAAAWLGREAFTGQLIPQPVVPGFEPAELRALTMEPRRYGFHATLKAPFQLNALQSEAALISVFERFASEMTGFVLPDITLDQIGSFFALVPSRPSEVLQEFAGACVRHFEPFRAPLSDEDIARRRPEKMDEAELRNLHRWGYPHVFEQFRFHMTLTGQVPAERQEAMHAVLAERFAPFLGRALAISHLSLFAEPAAGAPFTVRTILPLQSDIERKTA